MKAKRKSIVVQVTAHHNVEDFRPYTFRFADRGTFDANLKWALYKAVLKEGEWHGWFECPDEMLDGLEKEVENSIVDLVDGRTKNGEVTILFLDTESETKERDDRCGLVIWADRKEKNYGFGVGNRTSVKDKLDTDKYDNKWIEFVEK